MKKVILIIVSLVLMSALVGYAQQIRVTTTTRVAMTAPGNSDAVYISGQVYDKITWYYTVAAINTNVIVALQAKVGDQNWTTVESTVTQTANGDYGFIWAHAATADSIRFKWLSESGGTAATITHIAKLVGGN